MTIYFVAGEVSADNHGAALMRSLRALDPELKFIGRGGPQMQQVAGAQFKNWIGDAAVLGLWEVLRKYGYFRKQFRQTLDEIRETQTRRRRFDRLSRFQFATGARSAKRVARP